MAIVITTKVLPATNTKGARIKVTNHASNQSLTVSYDFSAVCPHAAAMLEMMARDYGKFWEGTACGGREIVGFTKTSEGMVCNINNPAGKGKLIVISPDLYTTGDF